MIYSVDSDVLIHLKRYYPQNRFSKEWRLFEEKLKNGTMKFSRQVYNEIKKGDDILSDWIGNFVYAMFDDTKEIQDIVTEVINKYKFVYDLSATDNIADPYVLAVAKHLNGTVITDEGNGHLNPFLIGNLERMKAQPKKVKLNLICNEEGVPCLSLMQFLAESSKGYNVD